MPFKCLGAHRAVDGQEKHCCTGDMRIGSTVMPSCDLTARHSTGPQSRCLPGGACIYDSEITWPATAISRCTRCRNGPHTCSQTSATGMYSVMLLPSNCVFEIASWATVLLEPPLFMTALLRINGHAPHAQAANYEDKIQSSGWTIKPSRTMAANQHALPPSHNTHIKRAKRQAAQQFRITNPSLSHTNTRGSFITRHTITSSCTCLTIIC